MLVLRYDCLQEWFQNSCNGYPSDPCKCALVYTCHLDGLWVHVKHASLVFKASACALMHVNDLGGT
jgi:hypothetical protein